MLQTSSLVHQQTFCWLDSSVPAGKEDRPSLHLVLPFGAPESSLTNKCNHLVRLLMVLNGSVVCNLVLRRLHFPVKTRSR